MKNTLDEITCGLYTAKKRKKNTDLENIGKETVQNEAHRIIILNLKSSMFLDCHNSVVFSIFIGGGGLVA